MSAAPAILFPRILLFDDWPWKCGAMKLSMKILTSTLTLKVRSWISRRRFATNCGFTNTAEIYLPTRGNAPLSQIGSYASTNGVLCNQGKRITIQFGMEKVRALYS